MEIKKKETEINKDMGIERFKTVKLWIKKACNSEETIRPYVIIIRQFLEYCEENPDKIIQEWKEVRYRWTERQKFLDRWNERLEEYYVLLNHAPLTKKQKISVVMSFFHHHKIPVEIEIQKYAYVKYHNRDITKEEIRKVLEHSGLRERTFDLMTIEGGFRPNTLAQLKYRDIREEFEAMLMVDLWNKEYHKSFELLWKNILEIYNQIRNKGLKSF